MIFTLKPLRSEDTPGERQNQPRTMHRGYHRGIRGGSAGRKALNLLRTTRSEALLFPVRNDGPFWAGEKHKTKKEEIRMKKEGDWNELCGCLVPYT
jgi:hypothetical protein